ncbi:hypothetical protein K440DRAFT_635258 [Wilcoxina mikolae CBS 423.85]|nr:hypothetical protein K440DRAFT_635258 [Wilcoxina mikolae CBS 423.85]
MALETSSAGSKPVVMPEGAENTGLAGFKPMGQFLLFFCPAAAVSRQCIDSRACYDG